MNWYFRAPVVAQCSVESFENKCDRLQEWWTFMMTSSHDDIIKWKHFPRHWPFVRGIHRSPVNSLHKGQWRGALMVSLNCAWTNGWGNNRDTSDLRHHHAHYDITVMSQWQGCLCFWWSMITDVISSGNGLFPVNTKALPEQILYSCQAMLETLSLTHLSLVPYICISESSHNWFR